MAREMKRPGGVAEAAENLYRLEASAGRASAFAFLSCANMALAFAWSAATPGGMNPGQTAVVLMFCGALGYAAYFTAKGVPRSSSGKITGRGMRKGTEK